MISMLNLCDPVSVWIVISAARLPVDHANVATAIRQHQK